MYTLNEIKELISILDQSSVQELEIEKEGFRMHIRKASNMIEAAPIISGPVNYPPAAHPPAQQVEQHIVPSSSQASTTSADDENLHRIVSPMVGTFYQAPSPDAASYVKVGDRVKEKTVVCIVEAMKLMNEIEAEVSGEIVEILVDNGQLVEYGQPLFLVRRA